ncbi:MAG TPA: hypothetical protein VGC30_11865 [Dokdonella sp.]
MTATPVLSTPWRVGILAILAIVMLATRSHLLGDHFLPLPDASWAVFFVAGFYSSARAPGDARGTGAWMFLALLALAVLIDYAVITAQGIGFWQHYCVSPAYWFLLPSYAALWLGGAWTRARYAQAGLRELGCALAAAAVAASVCFLISNGSFYWLSASVPVRSFAGWIENLGDWYVPFVRATLIYVAVAAALHALAIQALRWMPGRAGHGVER